MRASWRERWAGSRLSARGVVVACALAAFVLRVVGIGGPPGSDEAGFLLVARTWDPQPDSLYGPHFVDRAPLVIAVFRYAGALDGVTSVRILGAVACAVLVVASAAIARLIAGGRAPVWVAALVAALTTHPMIDPSDVKGEILGLPLVMLGCWWTLAAVRRRSGWLAFAAGVSASLAVGLKQNLLGAVVFAGVLLLASTLAGRLDWRTFGRLAGTGLLGMLVHPAATVAWALWAGVDLSTLWYAAVEFRVDANEVLSSRHSPASSARAVELAQLSVATGITVVLALFVVTLRRSWARDWPLTAAILALAAYDVAALVSSGSYWDDYLFVLIPGAALAAAAVIGTLERGSAVVPVALGVAGMVALSAVGSWVVSGAEILDRSPDDTGPALAEVADPDDTLVVFGGNAHVQLHSGLPSPYTHLWSLPMRTMDPELAELGALVTGPEPPTWLVESVEFEAWQPEAGARLRELVEERYDSFVPECGVADRIWLSRGADREMPQLAC